MINERMNMEHWWNDTVGRRLKYSKKNVPQYHFTHHKFHMDWPQIEPGTLR
jgi:hypothetical protein